MDSTMQAVLQFVEENDVKFIRLAFCDVMGTLKNIAIMPSELPRAFETGVSFDASSILGFAPVDKSDLFLFPDAATLSVLPWRPQTGRVVRFFCSVRTADGSPYGADGRHILRRTLRRMQATSAVWARNVNFTCLSGTRRAGPPSVPRTTAAILTSRPWTGARMSGVRSA